MILAICPIYSQTLFNVSEIQRSWILLSSLEFVLSLQLFFIATLPLSTFANRIPLMISHELRHKPSFPLFATQKSCFDIFFFLLFRGLKYVIHNKLKKCHKNNFFYKLSSSPKFVFQEYIIEEIDKISGIPFHENLISQKNLTLFIKVLH